MKEWYIFFMNGNLLIDKVLKSGYQHIFVIGRDDYNWYLINPMIDKFNFEILPFEPEDIASIEKHYISVCEKVLHFTNDNPKKFNYFQPFSVATCVQIIKYILRIKCWSITPYQLYKHLIKIDGKNGYTVKELN